MPGGVIVIITQGGGTVPRTPNTFPVAVGVGDWISNESHDPAYVTYQLTPSGQELNCTVNGKDTYTFGSACSVLSVT